MTIADTLHNSATHKPGSDPACPKCASAPDWKKQVIALVYQGGICNVFLIGKHDNGIAGGERRRISQQSYRTCESFARGAMFAGARCEAYSCNMAGDISGCNWTRGLEACPFRDSANPPAGTY